MDAPAYSPDGKERLRIRLGGAVQGVGFRPFVYRLANSLQLRGFVDNNNLGLHIEVEGEAARLASFEQALRRDYPPHARILTWESSWLPPAGYGEFRIAQSDPAGAPAAGILPDLAPCPDCIREVIDDCGRRQGYPFTNCTRCGPRFTILRSLPYDRPNTSMVGFVFCADCRREYEDPGDRRFHAQPVACPACGPRLSGSLEEAAAALRAGHILALKGVGGYQLLGSCKNEATVLRLRERKAREWKPFAVMALDLEQARALAEVSEAEAQLLTSSAAPIVLLKKRSQTPLAPSVCGVSPYVGVLLPASPLHYLLSRACGEPLVCTSGNRSNEPIAVTAEVAHETLANIADLFLDHDRPIERPCDDSVARVVGGRTAVLRRARGYAPLPVPLRRAAPRVLAVGGHLKNTVCLGVGRQAVLSQHLGDLDSPEARGAFERAIADLQRLYGFQPEVVACDLHPDYFSTQWAESTGLPLVRVQHHEAHALSCLLENDAEEPALAVSWDGTGYGHDGTIWGSEFYLVGPDSLRRVAHLKPFPLAGGDAGAKDCGRSAAGLLHRMGEPLEGPLGQVLSRGTGCVETTSMGRLFDAVAWLLGIAWRNRFEGEAGLALEAAAASSLAGGEYPMGREGDWGPLVDAIRSDMSAGAGVAEIAARFHRSLAAWVESVALEHGVRQVALSGGCFQNAVLTEMVSQRLERHGIRVLTHQLVPMNDGGLALGQLAAAMRVAG